MANNSFCLDGHQLPALIIIGAMSCATTSIAHALTEKHGFTYHSRFHDDLYGALHSDIKEAHFFSMAARVAKGLSYYASIFPPCLSKNHTLDASPSYLHTPETAMRLVELYGPERMARTTVVASLCPPIQRAQSSLYHFRGWTWASTWNMYEPDSITFREKVRRDIAADRLHDDVYYAWGQFGPQLDDWVDAVGRLYILAVPLYGQHPETTLRELRCLVDLRAAGRSEQAESGACLVTGVTDAAIQIKVGQARRKNSHSHPPLSADIDLPDAQRLERLFKASNAHVYDLIASDPRVTVLPLATAWRGFLESDLDATTIAQATVWWAPLWRWSLELWGLLDWRIALLVAACTMLISIFGQVLIKDAMPKLF